MSCQTSEPHWVMQHVSMFFFSSDTWHFPSVAFYMLMILSPPSPWYHKGQHIYLHWAKISQLNVPYPLHWLKREANWIKWKKINVMSCDKLSNQTKVKNYTEFSNSWLILYIHSFCVILITICLQFMFFLESGLVGLVQPMLWDYSPTLDVENTGKLGQNSLLC